MTGYPGTAGGLNADDIGPPVGTAPARDPEQVMHDLARVFMLGNQANSVTAAEIVSNLRAQDPALLTDWLDGRAAAIVTDYLNSLDRADRARARSGADARRFADMATRFSAGEDTAGFEAHYSLTNGVRKRLGDMTGRDHLFVSNRYERSSARDKFLAQVHLAISDRVGERRTEEVFTETEYAAMFA